jgi:WhiB family redox-sensing transcriptional regulator
MTTTQPAPVALPAPGSIPPPVRWAGTLACAGNTDHEFFPDDEAGDAAQAAKAVCSGCELRDRCLDYALSMRMTAGIWGGRSTREREALIKAVTLLAGTPRLGKSGGPR